MARSANRQRVMQRSVRLGHCICNPRLACPCDTFREMDVCACAGESRASDGPVRLTALTEKPGCASKIDQATLRRVVGGLPAVDDPRVLVGAMAGDDAGVYALDDRQALVQTVDVFTPCVDDPHLFGRIAAANSLSDIYAMGARPLTALSIVGFPARELPEAALRAILAGGAEVMCEAGVAVIGGHSIDDPAVKAGYAVTGLIDRGRVVTNAAAKPGNALVLTKPLGTGVIAFAGQISRARPEALAAAGESMATLNRQAAELMLRHQAHACTDVTGFGLAGHLSAMAAAAGLDAELDLAALPLLPQVRELLAQGVLGGAAERNRESSSAAVRLMPGADAALAEILFDPQTSGGLLIALPQERVAALMGELIEHGIEAAVIGHLRGPGRGTIEVYGEGHMASPGGRTESREQPIMNECCAGHGAAAGEPQPAGASDAERAFQQFLAVAHRPGALDAHTKLCMALALSVLARCEPCVKGQLKKARDAGLAQAEIDEAVWMAVSFGGAPLWMWYKSLMERGDVRSER